MDLDQDEFEESLLEWDVDPISLFGIPDYLTNACSKVAAPLIRTAEKKGENIPLNQMLTWPGEALLNDAIKLAMDGHPNYQESVHTEDTKREFLDEINSLIWTKTCENLTEEGIQKIEKEVEISYITQEITKVIKLEQYYTSLKPLGMLFWDRASRELKELVEDEALLYITEEPTFFLSKENPKARREIPNWVRGLIIAKAIQGNKDNRDTLNPSTRIKPDAQSFRTAAVWALGNHLSIRKTPQYIENTIETFEALRSKRKRANLNLRTVPVDEILPEIEIDPPTSQDGQPYPWLLCWGFLPNTDNEVRELAETWKEKSDGHANIHSQYHYRFLQRCMAFLIKREILTAYETRATLRENWLAKTGIKEPIMEYLKERIPQQNRLLFSIIFSECVWKQFAPMAKP